MKVLQSIHSQHYRFMIGELVAARKAAGLTQEDVAAQWGRKQSIIAKVETCERRIDTIEFIVLAGIVGLDPVAVTQKVVATIKKG